MQFFSFYIKSQAERPSPPPIRIPLKDEALLSERARGGRAEFSPIRATAAHIQDGVQSRVETARPPTRGCAAHHLQQDGPVFG